MDRNQPIRRNARATTPARTLKPIATPITQTMALVPAEGCGCGGRAIAPTQKVTTEELKTNIKKRISFL